MPVRYSAISLTSGSFEPRTWGGVADSTYLPTVLEIPYESRLRCSSRPRLCSALQRTASARANRPRVSRASVVVVAVVVAVVR